MRYRHTQLGEVELAQGYDAMAMVITASGERRGVEWQHLTPLESNVIPLRASQSPTSSTTSSENVVELAKPESGTASKPEALAINAATMQQISASLPGIGKSKAMKIISNRPESGYRGWDEFYDLNKDLLDSSEAWDAVRRIVNF